MLRAAFGLQAMPVIDRIPPKLIVPANPWTFSPALRCSAKVRRPQALHRCDVPAPSRGAPRAPALDCICVRAAASPGKRRTAAWDDLRHRGPTDLRRLLSPGLSERLARRSTDEWASSIALVTVVGAQMPAKRAKHKRASMAARARRHRTPAARPRGPGRRLLRLARIAQQIVLGRIAAQLCTSGVNVAYSDICSLPLLNEPNVLLAPAV
jgi:hypothetical protein